MKKVVKIGTSTLVLSCMLILTNILYSRDTTAQSRRWTECETTYEHWEVFTNERFPYSVTYPSGAVVRGELPNKHPNSDVISDVSIAFRQSFDSNGSKGMDNFDFRITVHDNPNHVSAIIYATSQPGFGDSNITSKQVKIGRLAGYEVRDREGDQITRRVYLADSNRIYELSFWDPDSMYLYPDSVRQCYAAIFERMVKSFTVRSLKKTK
jgi:hypothetical protein